MEDIEDKKKQVLQSLEETQESNQKSISGLTNVLVYLPSFHKANQLIGLQIEALKQVPAAYFAEFPPEALRLIEANNASSCQFYEQVQQVSPLTVGTATSATVSGATSVYNLLDSKKEKPAKKDLEKAAGILRKSFADDKSKSDRKSEIRGLLEKLLRPEENRYDLIMDEVSKAKLNIQTLESLALSMRTLMEKIKGKLKSKLPNQVGIKSNKILPAVAEQLVDPAKSSATYNTYNLFIEQFNLLTQKLTNIGKWIIKDKDGLEKLEMEFDSVIYSLLFPLREKL